MRRAFQGKAAWLAAVVSALTAAAPLCAQRHAPAPPRMNAPRAETPAPKPDQPRAPTPDDAAKTPRAPESEGRPQPLGGGLEQLSKLPYDQQVQQLNSDPNFKKLPPGQRGKMLQQLQSFDQLAPEQKQRQIQRLHDLGQLTPAQLSGLTEVHNAFQNMAPARQRDFRQAFNRLNGVSEQDRDLVLRSRMFQQRFGFSPAETQTLRQALALKLPPDVIGSAPPDPNLPH